MLAVVSHWTADSTALDAVGGNDATLVSGATYAPGQIGQAFSFDGIDDRALVADDPSLALTGSMTIEGWVLAKSYPTPGGVILFRGDDRGGLDPYVLDVLENGTARFKVQSLTATAAAVAPIPLNQFVHLAGTLDDATGQIRLYVNGVHQGDYTTDVRPFGALDPDSNPAIGIGNHGGYPATPHNFPFDGLIDELTVHDTALSESEVLSIYNAGKGDLQPQISVSDTSVVEGDTRLSLFDDYVTEQLGGLRNPRGIAFGPQGDLFVASSQPAQVRQYNGDTGEFVGIFADASEGGANLTTTALVFDAYYLYVGTGTSNSVLRYDALAGTPAPAPGQNDATFVATGAGGLSGAWGMTVGPDGHLYVSSYHTNSVLKYDITSGAYIGDFVAAGSGGLQQPTAITFDSDGILYVGSNGTDEVLRYEGPSGASPGAFLDRIVSAQSGGLDGASGLAFSPHGDLYVSSRLTDEILRFDGSTGAFVESLRVARAGTLDYPFGIEFDDDGTLFAASCNANRVMRSYPSSVASFDVELSFPIPEPVTVDFSTTDGTALVGSDYEDVNDTLTFAPGEFSKTIIVPTIDDSELEADETFVVNLSNATGGATIADALGDGAILDNDQITLFSDSFEHGAWNGQWSEDSQNDWFTSTQRETDGNYSAEVDGRATDATLTVNQTFNMEGIGSAELTLDWYIESGLDAGEYLALDLFDGASWNEAARLSGNADPENTWHSVAVTIDGAYLVDNFQFRFRAKMSGSNEDANVDNVQLVATSPAGPPNQTPSITSAPVTAAIEDALYNYDCDADDPDAGDILTFSLDVAPTGMTIDAVSGLIEWTPTNAHVGPNSVTVRVEDEATAFDTQSFSIGVANTNDPPTITSSPVTSAAEGSLYTYDVEADDPDVGDALTFSLDTAPVGMTIDTGTGVIQWTPVIGDAGDHPVTVSVTDSGLLSDAQSYTLTVTEPNYAPEITSSPVTTATEDVLYSYDCDASDPNAADTLTFSLDVAPTGMTIDSVTGLIDWTPGNADVGPHSVTVRVEDDFLAYDTQDFTLTVLNVNDPPVAVDDSTTTDQDMAVTVDVLGNDSDVDGDSLQVSEVTQGANGSAAINPDNTVTYTPNAGYVGDDNFTYTADDGHGGTDTATVHVTVQSTSNPTMSVVDLDGSGQQINKRKWAATVMVNVEDSSGAPVENATIQGTWSNGVLSTASTDGSGEATVYSGNVSIGASITFTVDSISHASFEYDAADNSDPDGDSDGTSIIVILGQGLLAIGDATTAVAAANLTQDVAETAANRAATFWSQLAAVPTIAEIQVAVIDLPAGTLGWAYGNMISLDINADGAGWYVDLTTPITSQFDLLTVVTHELGHLLGYDHSTDVHDVMAARLPVGTRRLPVIAPLAMYQQVLARPPLLPEIRQNVIQPEPVDDTISASDTNSDMLLLPLVPADYVELPRSSPEAIEVRILNDIADEETELLDEELLDMIASP